MRTLRQPFLVTIAAVAFISGGIAFAQPGTETRFAEANAAYEKAEYSAAVDIYNTLIDSGFGSDAVYYNLGNAHFRLGSPGLAALNYERALLINPGHQEALRNLEFVRKQTGAAVPPPDWRAKVLAQVPPGLLAWLIAGLCWLSLAAGFVALRSRPLLPHAVVVLVMAIPLALFSLWLLQSTGGGAWNTSRQIVVPEGSKAYSAPMTTSTEIMTPTPGSELALIAVRDSWSHVRLPDGRPAWVRSKDIHPIVKDQTAAH